MLYAQDVDAALRAPQASDIPYADAALTLADVTPTGLTGLTGA